MEPGNVEFRKGRVGVEKLEPRIAPAIVMVNGGGNTPQGQQDEDILVGDNASLDRSGVNPR